MSADIVHSTRDSDVHFGFWLYLMSDAILFGMLFSTFVLIAGNTAGGPAGVDLFSLSNVSMETALLLTSTLTIALAYQDALADRRRGSLLWLTLTLVLGAGFLGLELREMTGMIASGAGPARSGFLSGFFTLVGTHGLHVTAGVVWGLALVAQLLLRGPGEQVTSRLLRLTLFWHFLDIVWIGVFSTVYLPGIMA